MKNSFYKTSKSCNNTSYSTNKTLEIMGEKDEGSKFGMVVSIFCFKPMSFGMQSIKFTKSICYSNFGSTRSS